MSRAGLRGTRIAHNGLVIVNRLGHRRHQLTRTFSEPETTSVMPIPESVRRLTNPTNEQTGGHRTIVIVTMAVDRWCDGPGRQQQYALAARRSVSSLRDSNHRPNPFTAVRSSAYARVNASTSKRQLRPLGLGSTHATDPAIGAD